MVIPAVKCTLSTTSHHTWDLVHYTPVHTSQSNSRCGQTLRGISPCGQHCIKLYNCIIFNPLHRRWRSDKLVSVADKDKYKRQPTLQASSKFGLCYTPCILALILGPIFATRKAVAPFSNIQSSWADQYGSIDM